MKMYLTVVPNNPRVDKVSGKDQITLKLNKPSGRADSYMVQCNPNCGSHTALADKPVVSMLFDGLQPYTAYQFQIQTIAGTKQSALFLKIQTNQSGKLDKAENIKRYNSVWYNIVSLLCLLMINICLPPLPLPSRKEGHIALHVLVG